MTTRNVMLINASSTDIDFPRLIAVANALQIQVERDFSPVWNVMATVTAWGGGPLPRDAWQIRIVDQSVSGGVHLDENFVPYAEVEAREGWPLRVSHELLEMLVDPLGKRLADAPSIRPKDKGRPVSYIIEVCDPCQQYSYTINGVPVSDFVTPRYYRNPHRDPFRDVTFRDQIPTPEDQLDFLGLIDHSYQVPRGCYISWLDPMDKHNPRRKRFLYQKDGTGRFVKSDDPLDAQLSPRANRDKAFGSDEDDGQHQVRRFMKDIAKGRAANNKPSGSPSGANVNGDHPTPPTDGSAAPPAATAAEPVASSEAQPHGEGSGNPVGEQAEDHGSNPQATSPQTDSHQEGSVTSSQGDEQHDITAGHEEPADGQKHSEDDQDEEDEDEDDDEADTEEHLVVARAFSEFVRSQPTLSEATITAVGSVYHPDAVESDPSNPEYSKGGPETFTFVTLDGQVTRIPINAVRQYKEIAGGLVQLKLAAGKLEIEQRRMFAIARAQPLTPAPSPYEKWSDTQKEPPDDGLFMSRVAPSVDPFAKWSDTQKEPPDDGLFLSRVAPSIDPFAKWSDTQKEPPDDALFLSRAGGNVRAFGAGYPAAQRGGAGIAPFVVAIPHHTPLAATLMPGAMGQQPPMQAAPVNPAVYGFPMTGNGYNGSQGPWGDGMWLMMWRLPGFVY